jgi:hypothetical protein
MVNIDDYSEEKECTYKNERYSARDNGAVMRHPREGKPTRKDDSVWTFGKPNDKTGYMEIAGQRVHRIVAYAFHGNPPTSQHVVDHIDTNRRNNRPENLRWLTRLENVLNNPITRARIEKLCGSVEDFLEDPSQLYGYEDRDPNFKWMRTVTKEEAQASLERMQKWVKEQPKSHGGSLGEWVFQKPLSFQPTSEKYEKVKPEEMIQEIQSLTPNALQVNWKIPSEFPCCPNEITENPLETYKLNLKVDAIFCKNNYYTSFVMDSAISDEGNSLWVMTRAAEETIKPWALSRITYKDGMYYHESGGTFFEENGALKYFTLAQGKEWTGGDVFDDYC